MMARTWLSGIAAVGMLVGALGCVKPQPTEGAGEQKASGKATWKVVFEETFETPDWKSRFKGSETAWKVEEGSLRGANDRNAGLWWTGDLPRDARIEFEAKALSDHGDLKVEIFGTSRSHQAGYVVIFGGWKNRVSVLARLDEHGKDRIENRTFVPTPGKVHAFLIERVGTRLSVAVDGKPLYSLEDPQPIEGTAFGFANWEAPVQFDNLRISARGTVDE